jgi:membrane protease YdiL (CAAX protease family)
MLGSTASASRWARDDEDIHSQGSDMPQPPQQHPDPQAVGPSATPADDRLAARLRGFGPVGILAMLVITALGPVLEPLGAILALAWAHRSRTPWSEIGFVRPRSWARTVAIAIVLGGALKILMKTIVMPLLGANPINPTYHYLAGNTSALPEMLFDVTVGAGFGEETVFRGFLFERLGKLFGRGVGARVAIVLLTSALFGAIHYPGQGLSGAEQATITGLVFGTIFSVTGRIWPLVFAHAAFDVTAVFIIYWKLESSLAHLIIK